MVKPCHACLLVLCALLPMGTAFGVSVSVRADTEPVLKERVVAQLRQWSEDQNRPVLLEQSGVWLGSPFQSGMFDLTWQIKSIDARTRQVEVSMALQAASVSDGPAVPHRMRLMLRDLELNWVLQSTVGAGQSLDCTKDLVREWRLARPMQHARMQAPCDAFDRLVTRRPLAVGDVLLVADLGKPLAVRKMAVVQANAAAGGISIRTNAVALNDGDVGQQVSIKPAGGTRVVRATVIGPNEVLVN